MTDLTITGTWYGYRNPYGLGEPEVLEVLRETKLCLITPYGVREKKNSRNGKWFPSRREALVWAIERSNRDIISARDDLDDAVKQRRRLRQLLKGEDGDERPTS